PSWAQAKADASAAFATLRADPTKFDALARSESDEGAAKSSGGKQPWIYPTTTIDTAIKNAVLAEGLTNEQILAPVKGDIGWVVLPFIRAGGGRGRALPSHPPGRARAH